MIHDPLSESWDISTSGKNGHVPLTDAADSRAEREAIATIAKGVRGVRGVIAVTNNPAISCTIDCEDTGQTQTHLTHT